MKTKKGFTLIGLMIVVVVIGTSALSDGRVKMEHFFQDNRTYAGGTCPAEAPIFTYACSNLSATTCTITATGKGGLPAFNYTIMKKGDAC